MSMTIQEMQEFVDQYLPNTKVRSNLIILKIDTDYEPEGSFHYCHSTHPLADWVFASNQDVILVPDTHHQLDFTKQEIRSILAHEMGHSLHDHNHNKECEYIADKAVIRFGGNYNDLITALIKGAEHNDISLEYEGETHPSVLRRALALDIDIHYLLSKINER